MTQSGCLKSHESAFLSALKAYNGVNSSGGAAIPFSLFAVTSPLTYTDLKYTSLCTLSLSSPATTDCNHLHFCDRDIFINTDQYFAGDVLESRGSLYLRDSDIILRTAFDTISSVAYRADRDNVFMEVENTNIICPEGFSCT